MNSDCLDVPRRRVLLMGAAASVAVVAAGPVGANMPAQHLPGISDREWRRRLTKEAYAVLREREMEFPYSSALHDEARAGVYACGGCELPLFPSSAKYDSGTGWPSFTSAFTKAFVQNHRGAADAALVCPQCFGHLGYVFSDGPEQGGLRYCVNGTALRFDAVQTV